MAVKVLFVCLDMCLISPSDGGWFIILQSLRPPDFNPERRLKSRTKPVLFTFVYLLLLLSNPIYFGPRSSLMTFSSSEKPTRTSHKLLSVNPGRAADSWICRFVNLIYKLQILSEVCFLNQRRNQNSKVSVVRENLGSSAHPVTRVKSWKKQTEGDGIDVQRRETVQAGARGRSRDRSTEGVILITLMASCCGG